MLTVELPVVGMEVGALWIAALGLLVGCLAGFFGVGGGFVMTPMLNVLFGIPYNFAIGSSLAQMLGMSAAGSLQHRKLGNVDFKLGLLTVVAIMPGVEIGAQLLEFLEGLGSISIGGGQIAVTTLAISVAYVLLLAKVGLSMWRESRGALANGSDEPEISALGRALRGLGLPPVVSLPASGIERISVWAVFALGLVTGVLSGLLGVGGGFIFLPALIYVLGVPTTVAVGTSLFSILFASAYGTFTHSLKGNVDLVLVMLLLVPSAIGTQIGATLTKRVGGPRTRHLFSMVAAIAMLFVACKLGAKLLGY